VSTTRPRGPAEYSSQAARFCRPKEDFSQISNEILKALYSRIFTDWEKSVLLAVCRMTYGWPDRQGGIANSWFVKNTGIAKRHVREIVKNLLLAHVLTFRTPRRRGKALDLWVQEDMSLWDLRKLGRLRAAAKASSVGAAETLRGEEAVPDDQIGPRTESVPGGGTENVPGSAHGIRAPLNILNISLNKPGAANAAVSSSKSGEGKGEGLLGDERQIWSEEPPGPDVGIPAVSEEEASRIDRLRAKLKKVGLDPDRWLLRAVKERVPVEVITHVLEEGYRQRDIIVDFWPWAQKVQRVTSDTLAIEAAEREQQAFKEEGMQSAGQILKHVLQEGQQENAEG